MNLLGKQAGYVKTFGSPFVKEFFNTHLTLAGPDVNLKLFKKIISKKHKNDFQFTANNISIMSKEEGKWRIVDKIPLKQ